ncbi:MAG: cell division protein ZapC [Idiomarina sp.]|nr:cell division protein ZapC [Idiomarina sp.]
MQSWQWHYNQTEELLQIAVDGGLLHSLEYRKKHLRPDMPEEASFTMEDAEFFSSLLDYQENHSPYSTTEQLQVGFHGVAMRRFGKALMPQSWHFQTGVIEPWPQEHLFCTLNSGFAKGNFLIIDRDERTVLCMLIDASFEVATTKIMKRYEVIRVLQDRLLSSDLHPISQNSDNWQKFA